MADKSGDSAPKSDEKGGKGGKKPIILIIILVAVIGSSLIVGKVMLGGKGDKGKAESKEKVVEVGVSMPLEEFLVNLADNDAHYLKATVALGLKKGVTEEKLKEHVAPIRDAVVSVLSSMHLRPLGTEEGKEELKKVLKERINKVVPDAPVMEIYFTAFTTQ
jgi:flagellar protein FliL